METINCTYTDVSGQSTQGQAQLESLSTGARVARASKRAAIFWAIALVCVLIPMLHFVLVPAFLLIGIIMFAKTMSQAQLIWNADGECPACHAKTHFDGPINAVESKEICPSCRTLLKIKPAPLRAV
jgi:hypothetical protein